MGERVGAHRLVVLLADAVRVAGAVCVVVAGLAYGFVELATFALVLLGLMVPRAVGLPGPLDLAHGLALLAAAWISVAGLYSAVEGLDLMVHAVATGLIAAVGHLLLVRIGARAPAGDPLVPRHRIGTVVATAALGLALSVLWEAGEWYGYTYLDGEIEVGYDDTIGDLLAGGAGSLLAGAALAARPARWAQDRQDQMSSMVTRKPVR